jgi:asparagine synthase (glutamine-hydrolysing)
MCGLTGILSSTASADIIDQVTKMTAQLAHRGPDDERVWSENNIGLGHRRLAILDLSASGAQPMHSVCGSYVLAYNGEIYNHLELRRSLEKEEAAPLWRGQSDTETLLAAIVHWGLDEALCRAHGMFAIALWNRDKKYLSLARDRMGEKPLYWGWAGKDLIFGSELKALRAHPKCPSEVCRGALAQYLRFNYVPAPRSIHFGIYKLEPGTILTVHDKPPLEAPKIPIRPGESHDGLSIRRYWDINTEIDKGGCDLIKEETKAISLLDQVLSNAVKKQMISDVPLGAFLSGGVDSSAIVALMQAQSDRPVQTFTIGFDEANFDESLHAAAVAKHLGTDHTKLRVTEADARNVIPILPQLYDEPFADSSQIPTYLVCSAAREHVTVALSGDGGDELFGGYNRYIHGPSLWKRISNMPAPIRRLASQAAQRLPEHTWDIFGATYNRIRTGSAGISNLGTKVHRLSERLLLTESLDDLHRNMASTWIKPEDIIKEDFIEPYSQFNDPLPKLSIEDPAMRMMVQDMRSYLPDDILCKVDRAGMGISLETRTPFLDPDVIALAARLPTNLKIRDGHGKWVLRKVLYQHVPSDIIDRPKVGFAIPIGLWLRGPLRDWAEDLLSHKRLTDDGLFKPDIIRNTWSEHLSGRKDWSAKLWTILMFQAWRALQK